MARLLRAAAPTVALLLSCLLLSAISSGCNVIGTAFWIISPNDIKAEYPGLKGQRVAVVCRSANSLEYQNTDAAGEIAKQVATLLKQNVSRIDVVSQKDVDDWLDVNQAKSYVSLGKSLKADRVVVLDLEQFKLYQGQTLYQGQAQLTITVHDVKTGDKRELKPFESTYPPKNGVPVDVSEQHFRATFIGVLAGQIARRFYAYDSHYVDDNFYRPE